MVCREGSEWFKWQKFNRQKEQKKMKKKKFFQNSPYIFYGDSHKSRTIFNFDSLLLFFDEKISFFSFLLIWFVFGSSHWSRRSSAHSRFEMSEQTKLLFSTLFRRVDTDFFEICFFAEKLEIFFFFTFTIYVAMDKRMPPITRRQTPMIEIGEKKKWSNTRVEHESKKKKRIFLLRISTCESNIKESFTVKH